MARVLGGRYRIVETLGSGAWGQVHLAEDLLRPGCRLALKTRRIDPRETAPGPGGIAAEFRALARVRHPNLARVFDLGLAHDEASGVPLLFFTREYVDGADLVTAMRGASGKTLARAAAVLCHTLATIHDHGVIHGDLSPGNVLGAAGDPASLRIIDFGLSVIAGSGESSSSGLRGTLHYVAPEVLGGAPLSAQADLYALGALLYHAVAGDPPFRGSVAQVIQQHLDVAPAPLASVRDGLPAGLTAVVGRLLAKDPAHRYASARDALRDLDGTSAPAGVVPVPEAPLVGRDALLETVERLARKGSKASVVALVGADGAGKTRLLEALRWRLQLGGAVRVVDVSFGASNPDSLAPLREMAAHLRLLAPAAPGCDGVAAAFSRGEAPGDTDEAREALAAFTVRAMEGAAVVALIDDADAAAQPAFEILRHAARALDEETGAPPMVIAGRPGRAMDDLLGDLERAERLDVGELDAPSVDRMVEALAGSRRPDLAEKARSHAGALPGHVEEVTRALLDRERSGSDASLPVPAGLAGAIRDRLSRLGRPERDLLEILAVVGHAAAWSDVCGESGIRGEREFLDAGRRSCAAGFLAEVASGLFGFERPAVREAVYEACPPDRRRGLHAAVLAAIAPPGSAPPSGSRLAAAALHAVRSATPGAQGDRAVALALAASAELARHGDHGSSASLLREALGLASGARLLTVRIALAEALATTGDFDASTGLLDLAARDANGSEKGEVLALAGSVHERRGNYDEAARALEGAVAAGLPPDATPRTLETLARIHLARGSYADASATARGAAEAAAADGSLQARALATAGIAASYQGRHVEALGTLERARAAARACGDGAAEAVAVGHLAIAHGRNGDPGASLRMFAEAADTAERCGDLGRLPAHLVNLGTARHSLGEIGPSIDLYRRAARLARRMGKRSVVVAALVNLADRYAYLGAVEEGREAARRALDLALREGMTAFAARAHLALAECLADESPAAGLDDAERAAALFDGLGRPVDVGEARIVAAELLLWSGKPRRAEEAASEALDRVRGSADPDLEARAGLVLAESLVVLEEQTDRARAILEGLARDDAGNPRPDIRWRALATLAFLHARVGEDAAARARTAEALAVLGTIESRVPQEYKETFRERHPARRALQRFARREPPEGAIAERVFRLMAVNRAVVAEHDPSKILALALDTAIELCGAERGFLITLGARDAVRVEVARNLDHEAIRSAKLKVSRSIAEEVARTGVPILTLNAQEDERFDRFESVRDLKLRSVVCVPIRGRDGVLGTLYLDNRFQQGRFGEADLRLLLAFGDVVAVALENARLAEENARHAAELEQAKTALEAATREQARRLESALRELEVTREALGLKYDYSRIVGRSPGMLRVFQTLDRVIDTHVPILVQGESGTGKELIARAIHYNGARRDRPFVSINCGAIPDALMESELFGHVKGAFTGATVDREGLFAAAHRGTLLLDEIGDMSQAMQAKLLRALQEGEVRPVGSNVARQVDVRVLAASHRDLADEVAAGRFREDLFYRLNVVTITIPPLRERREDIPVLAEHVLDRFAGEIGGTRKRLAPDALDRLLEHSWPGNVRELENVLKNAAILARGEEILPADIHVARRDASGEAASATGTLAGLEKQAIRRALEAAGGNKKRAAEMLGISRLTLYRKLKATPSRE